MNTACCLNVGHDFMFVPNSPNLLVCRKCGDVADIYALLTTEAKIEDIRQHPEGSPERLRASLDELEKVVQDRQLKKITPDQVWALGPQYRVSFINFNYTAHNPECRNNSCLGCYTEQNK